MCGFSDIHFLLEKDSKIYLQVYSRNDIHWKYHLFIIIIICWKQFIFLVALQNLIIVEIYAFGFI